MANNITTGELSHFAYSRFRVTGNGTLQLILRSQDPNVNFPMTAIPLQTVTNREPIVYSNFIDQKAQLHGFTTNLDDDFLISRIVVWIKPISFNYPA